MKNSIRPLEYSPIILFVVEEEQLNRFITEYYQLKAPFSCHANELWRNDSTHRFQIVKEELDTYDAKKVQALMETPHEPLSYSVQAILQDLCNRGAIPPGHYLIEVSW